MKRVIVMMLVLIVAFAPIAWADTIDCSGKNPCVGTDGDDDITGTPGDDVIYGMGGNDTIDGLQGSDTIYGDDPNDPTVSGDDQLFVDYDTQIINEIPRICYKRIPPRRHHGHKTRKAHFRKELCGIEGSSGFPIPDDKVDTIIAGPGNDTVNVVDGDNLDVVDCGPGNDTLTADDATELSRATGCETTQVASL